MNRDTFQNYCDAISQIPKIPPDQKREVLGRAKNGDPNAIETVISSHLKLVVSIVGKFRFLGNDPLDLVGEGNLALYQALDSFDLEEGTEFTTWAYYHIAKAIQNYFREMGQEFKIPIEWRIRMPIVKNTWIDWIGAHGREPTTEELSIETGISQSMLRYLLPLAIGVIRLDCPGSIREHESDMESRWYARDPNVPSPHRGIERDEDILMVGQALQEIDPREAFVMKRLAGIDGPEMRMVDIAAEMGVSASRVGQLAELGRVSLYRVLEREFANTLL
jgi:RNA polymerase sigma factor (sigma-70 family)